MRPAIFPWCSKGIIALCSILLSIHDPFWGIHGVPQTVSITYGKWCSIGCLVDYSTHGTGIFESDKSANQSFLDIESWGWNRETSHLSSIPMVSIRFEPRHASHAAMPYPFFKFWIMSHIETPIHVLLWKNWMPAILALERLDTLDLFKILFAVENCQLENSL